MKKITKLKIIIILLIAVCSIVIFPTTLTLYKEKTQVSVTTKSGELIYDVIIDNLDNPYMDDERETPYFFITVRNYKNGGLTDVDIDYSLTITNKYDNVGLFSYEIDSETESTASDHLTITGSLEKGEQAYKTYKVYVYSNRMEQTTVNYQVNYEITQKRME